MDLKQAKAQDVILKKLDTEDHNLDWDISELSTDLSIEYNLCYVACEEIAYEREHADIERDRATEDHPKDKAISISPSGSVFSKSEDSYEHEFSAQLERIKEEKEDKATRKRKLVWDSQISS